ncbi:hypothetical protein CHS0354_018276, partial [Potamilus streckersoni]
SGHAAVLDLDGLVSSLDNQRVVVVPKDDCPGYKRRRSSLFAFIEKRVHHNCSKGSSVEKDATKGHICIAEERSQKTPKQWCLGDQHGVSMQALELPELVQKSDQQPFQWESVPPMFMRDFFESVSVKRTTDYRLQT